MSNSSVVATELRPAPSRHATPARPHLRSVPPVQRRSARAPFVVLLVALLGGGLVGLLLLNTAVSEGAFVESALGQRNARLSDAAQQLEQTSDRLSSPQQLAARARDLGMEPGGPPAFVDPDTGRVLGVDAHTARWKQAAQTSARALSARVFPGSTDVGGSRRGRAQPADQ